MNLYGYILETEYGMSVAGYYLAQVHPDGDAPRLISCPRMDAETQAIHNFEIECGRAGPVPIDSPCVLAQAAEKIGRAHV